jgi:nucleotide-binding universal stress UspA family protein
VLSSELIVMGTRGLGAVHHALIGSVAMKVALASAVPVVLVGEQGA